MRNLLLTTAIFGGLAAFFVANPSRAAEIMVHAPAPRIDATPTKTPGTETAIISGGCFWGMQVVFQHLKGVTSAVSGYTGGAAATAHYDDVSSGTTGQAESVKITFDPSVISYGRLLQVYFSVAADPTELNYQGPDEGSQYRSDIWVETPQQRKIANAYIKQLATAHIFAAPIVTRIDTAMPFYPAERYHQNYATLHPDNGYITVYDAPKVRALAAFFPALYRGSAQLVQVSAMRAGSAY